MDNKSFFLDGKDYCATPMCAGTRILMTLLGVMLLFLTLPGFHPAMAADTPAAGTWVSAGSQVKIQLSNPLRNRRSNDATVNVQVGNGSTAITGPLRLVLGGLTPAAKVSIQNPTGLTDSGEPYFNLNAYIGGDNFAANGSGVLTLTVLGGGPNTFSFTPRVERLKPAPPKLTVKITTPSTLITVGRSPIKVQGTVSDSAASVTLNGAPITPAQNGSFAADVSLQEGHNTVIARATGTDGQEVTDSISISLDKTPPYLTVESPKDGDVVYVSKIDVSGLVNDIVRGTVSEGQANVTVNGITAAVSNRSYSVQGLPLQVGDNLITVNAADQEGNASSIKIKVVYQVPVTKHIELVSGENQTAKINTSLPNPLKVKLIDENNKPAPDKSVVFRVQQGDGILGDASGDQGQGVLVKTDSNGVASIDYKLGLRSGQGNHRVRAAAVGYDGEVIFSASAEPSVGNKVSVNSGNTQRGAVSQPLPLPFVVVVTDEGSNVVQGAKVEFKVSQGGGKFQDGNTSTIVTTDSDGRASAQLTLGSEEGLDVQRATATLVGTNLYAAFTASGFKAGAAGNTSVTGVVLDNQDKPLPNVSARIDGTTREAKTDAQGKFKITEVPVGPVRLFIDGSTTTVAGEWPTLPFNIVTIAGAENPLPAPVYLVKLNPNAVTVADKDVEITLPEVPGFKLEVKAGSVTFPDGKKTGKLSVTPVNADKVPMAPPNGMQPQFIVTIQPVGAKFDPPARLTLPNVDGHKPGAQVEMYSFDHDLEEFVSIGLGTVSADGSLIASNPGVGVIKAGWHCGSQPGGSGCAYNAECQTCDGSCNIHSDDSKIPKDSTAKGDCKKSVCSGGSSTTANDDTDKPPEKCASCKNGTPVPPPTDAQCCTIPNAGTLLAGTVVCCRGKTIVCMYPDNIPSKGNALGYSIAQQCIAVHEQTHFNHINCDDGDCEVQKNPNPSVTQAQAECEASKAEKNCYDTKRPTCSLSPDQAACEAVVDYWVQEAINYGNSFFPSPATCF